MPTKKISAAAIVALRDALSNVYWYKSDLRSFLTSTLTNPELLSRLNWDDYKRNVVGQLIGFLERGQDEYQADLLRLMTEVARVDDYSHLERLDEGKKKAAAARSAVSALRRLTVAHEALFEEQRKKEERRRKAHESLLALTAVRARLDELTKEYFTLLKAAPQDRGYRLEKILRAGYLNFLIWTLVPPSRLWANRSMGPSRLTPQIIFLKLDGNRNMLAQPT